MLIVISEVQDICVHYICKECKETLRFHYNRKATKAIKIKYIVFCGNRSCFDWHIIN